MTKSAMATTAIDPRIQDLFACEPPVVREHLRDLERAEGPQRLIELVEAALAATPPARLKLEFEGAGRAAQRHLEMSSDPRFHIEADLLPYGTDRRTTPLDVHWFDEFKVDERYVAAPNAQIMRRRRATVLPDVGVVEFDHPRPLVLEGSLSPISLHVRGAPTRAPIDPKPVDAAVVVRFQQTSNYFHSLVDLAEVVYAIRRISTLPIVIGTAMRGPIETMLDLLDIDGVHFAEEDLTVEHAYLARVDRRWADLADLCENVRAAIDPSDGPPLYISRADSRTRPLLNESEVESFFESHGYEVMVPTEHTVLQQWTAAASTDRVAGPHGAGLTSAIFMKPGGRLIELTHPYRHDVGYSSLSKNLGFDFRRFDGEAEKAGNLRWTFDTALLDAKLLTGPIELRPAAETPQAATVVSAAAQAHSDVVADVKQPGVTTTRIIGLQRSGNHAIVEWLQRNLAGEHAIFINNATVREGRLEWFGGGDLPQTGRVKWGERPPPNQLLGMIAEQIRPDSHLLISTENKDSRQLWPESDDPMSSDGTFDRDVVIVRSFFNWFASCHRLFSDESRGGNFAPPLERDSKLLTLTRRWTEYAGLASSTPHEWAQRPMLFVDYDRWCADEKYRAGLLAELDIEVVDNSRHILARQNGSSFEGENVKDATTLALDERWRWFMESSDALGILQRCLLDSSVREAIDRYHGAGHLVDMEHRLGI